MRCQYCLAENNEYAHFCQNCGKSLKKSRFGFIKRHSGWLKGFILFFIFIVLPVLFTLGLFSSVGSATTQQKVLSGSGKDTIALVNIDGTISEGGGSGFPTSTDATSSRHIHELLQSVSEDPRVKALILRVNSPGGSAAASEEIYQELLRYKSKHNQKIVAYFSGMAASGGYYVAMAADKIVANPAVQTGNIGVITYIFNVQGLADKYGVKSIVYKSGQYKDLGSPFRQPTKEEDAIMQSMIGEVFDRFVTVVSEGRKMDQGVTRTLADGRIYTANQAKTAGLVDEIGDLETTIAITKQLTGLSEAKVVEYNRIGGLFESLLGRYFLPNVNTMAIDRYASLFSQPGFLYLHTQ